MSICFNYYENQICYSSNWMNLEAFLSLHKHKLNQADKDKMFLLNLSYDLNIPFWRVYFSHLPFSNENVEENGCKNQFELILKNFKKQWINYLKSGTMTDNGAFFHYFYYLIENIKVDIDFDFIYKNFKDQSNDVIISILFFLLSNNYKVLLNIKDYDFFIFLLIKSVELNYFNEKNIEKLIEFYSADFLLEEANKMNECKYYSLMNDNKVKFKDVESDFLLNLTKLKKILSLKVLNLV